MKFNFIDLFAGAGGLSCGMELAGHKCLLGVDVDKHAMKTFEQNHKYSKAYCGDIKKLKGKTLKEYLGNKTVHVVVGGPPCQGFSTVGVGNPKDLRNSLFLEYCRIVKETKPYFIIMENVTGLLAKKNETTLNNIFKKFESMGYHMDVKVMASQNYGVPEKRRRTIIIGSRLSSKIKFPVETHDTYKNNEYIPPALVGEVLEDLECSSGDIYNHDLSAAGVRSKLDLKRIKRIPEGQGIRYQKDEKSFLPPSLRLDVVWEELPEKRFRQTKYCRLDRFKPSPTILTSRYTYYHPTEHRYLTQREAAKLQSFPNDFVFHGPVAAQWKQIGNAVPPIMAKALGKALISMYKSAKSSKNSNVKITKSAKSKISQVRSKAFVYRGKEAQ
ncbi:MAG: DNA cytosine methyltransferase [Bacteriovoracaceae bacterium]|jgi:DNA (cytosine-5)-methyltransferase 1|nr:DNA cytosine methyltransferase [Bacteriovoracaceae bacterium]